jgi:hypothetical protein
MSTLVAEYNLKKEAQQAAQTLFEHGFQPTQVALRFQPDAIGTPSTHETVTMTMAGTILGAIIGALVGVVVGIYLDGSPGDGAVVAAGPIHPLIGAIVVGIGFGAIGGGFILNAILKINEPEEGEVEFPRWERCLVTVEVDPLNASQTQEILSRTKAVDIELIYKKPWRYTRWSHFSEAIHPEPEVEEEPLFN